MNPRWLEASRLPLPDTADVDVNKIGLAIVPDPTTLERQGGGTQLGSRHARHPDVNRHALHMQAVCGHAGGVTAKESIGPGRTVAANHIDLTPGVADCPRQVVEQIEKSRVERVDVAGEVVTQIMVELGERLREVGAPPAVHYIQAFPSVRVVKAEPVGGFGRRRRRRLGGRPWQTQKGGEQRAAYVQSFSKSPELGQLLRNLSASDRLFDLCTGQGQVSIIAAIGRCARGANCQQPAVLTQAEWLEPAFKRNKSVSVENR